MRRESHQKQGNQQEEQARGGKSQQSLGQAGMGKDRAPSEQDAPKEGQVGGTSRGNQSGSEGSTRRDDSAESGRKR